MKFWRATLETCSSARGVVVVIDVLRAFSMAAYALAAGAREIWLVRTVDEARSLAQANPGFLLMGEVNGLHIEGFDYSNSPVEMEHASMEGRTLVQRTGAGTQGVVLSSQADKLYACSFIVAGATAEHIRRLNPPEVTFVITGAFRGGYAGESGAEEDWGDEDAACADYLEALIKGEQPDPGPYLQRVADSPAGQLFLNPALPEYRAEDLHLCTLLDRFDFIMPVQREHEQLVMRRG